MRMRALQKFLIGLSLAYICFTTIGAAETGECQAMENGSSVCSKQSQRPDRCKIPTSLYSWGGTAVAYRPDAAIQSNICSNQSKYKVASWFVRRATWSLAPKVTLKIQVYDCAANSNEECICSKTVDDFSLEVWQAQPDGNYPSLRSDSSSECRAKQIGSNGDSALTFETLAPGSTGSMGGLGPSGWDFGPYKPPVIHILVRGADGQQATLVDLPVSVHPKTLEQTFFRGPDFSGAAWTRSKGAREINFMIESWTAFPTENRAEVDVAIYLPPSQDGEKMAMCPSFVYGNPKSFFTEPIAVCAPSMLNFFAL